ncbi:hypothetical protein EV356DRAFT_581587 [Viridothelium virens]|uniref:Uncharacterized protein n=1 Tax=Viridothelium virens TaxID=1048519 RepID=A0A6A6GRR4_VIRVR|nr:hypothetical protein EV356DRAFT_581587 [Viridothelium virens]
MLTCIVLQSRVFRTSRLAKCSVEASVDSFGHLLSLRTSVKSSRTELLSEFGRSVAADEVAIETDDAVTDHLQIGRLSLRENDYSRFINGAYWANICNEAMAVDELLRAQSQSQSVSTTASEEIIAQSPLAGDAVHTSRPTSLSSTVDDTKYLDDIFSSWDGAIASSRFSNRSTALVVDLLAPIVHIPSLQSDYDIFWAAAAETGHPRPATVAPLIPAILFAGAISLDESEIATLFGCTKSSLLSKLHRCTTMALRTSGFPRTPTIESFTAYLTIECTNARCTFIASFFHIHDEMLTNDRRAAVILLV